MLKLIPLLRKDPQFLDHSTVSAGRAEQVLPFELTERASTSKEASQTTKRIYIWEVLQPADILSHGYSLDDLKSSSPSRPSTLINSTPQECMSVSQLL